MTKILNIGRDFSADPEGRYKTDGPASGEAFREDCLLPKLEGLDENEVLVIILDDNVEGYGSSFLTEGFAGVVKYGHMHSDELLKRIRIQYDDIDFEFYKNKILKYIKEAKFDASR